MQLEIESPLRLVTMIILFLCLLLASWNSFFRDGSAASSAAPAVVQEVIDQSSKRKFVLVEVQDKLNGNTRRLLTPKGVAFYTQGQLTYLQRGKNMFSGNSKNSSCYFKSRQEAPIRPPFVQEFLPTGAGNIDYTSEEKNGKLRIKWTIEAPDGVPENYKPPQGMLVADGESRLLESATTVSSSLQSTRVIVSYPKKGKLPPPPKRECRQSQRDARPSKREKSRTRSRAGRSRAGRSRAGRSRAGRSKSSDYTNR